MFGTDNWTLVLIGGEFLIFAIVVLIWWWMASKRKQDSVNKKK